MEGRAGRKNVSHSEKVRQRPLSWNSVHASPTNMLQASRIVSGATHARPTRAGKSGLAHSSLKLQNAAPRTHLRLPRPLVQRREFSNAIKMAKEFGISFYNGSKDLWTNFNESRALKQKKEAGQDLTRSEIRFINRTNDDLWVR